MNIKTVQPEEIKVQIMSDGYISDHYYLVDRKNCSLKQVKHMTLTEIVATSKLISEGRDWQCFAYIEY